MKNPPLLYSLSVALMLLAPPSSAQTSPSPTAQASSTPKATPAESNLLTGPLRQLYEDGRKAAQKGRWLDAHAAFLTAWQLERHHPIALNLGLAELKLGKYRDASEHLTWYLHEAPAENVQERQIAERSLKEALAKVASVTVTVVPQGAEVTVDGVAVERSPAAVQVFLDPGEHEIGAKLDGHMPEKRTLAAKAGGTEAVELRLKLTPAPVVAQSHPAALPRPDPSAASRDKLRRAVLIGGSAATVVGVATGMAFTMLANDKESHADELRAQVDRDARDKNQSPCPNQVPKTCAELRDTVDAKVDFSNVALWSFISAGTIGIGTLVYGLVTRKAPEPDGRVMVMPVLGPGTAGISLVARR